MNATGHDFTVIIPTYNRPEQLANCLRAFTALNYPRALFELIIVDDGGQMSLQAAIASVSRQLNVTLIEQMNAGPATARNNAAAHARGELLAFTDDDCLPSADWLSVLAEKLKAEPKSMAGGRTINALADNPFATASQLIVDLVYAHYNTDARRARFLASNNMAMPADLFHLIGGFNPSFRTSEDRDLCDRWLGSGYRIIYLPAARVYHQHRLTLRAYWRQHIAYGEGAFRFNRHHAQRDATKSTLDPNFYLQTLLRLPIAFSQMRLGQAFMQAALLFLWQVANGVGFVVEGLRYVKKKDMIPNTCDHRKE